MQRVFVLSRTKTPLMPRHPARARQLLRDGKAAVFKRYPFTIILKARDIGDVQPLMLKVDPGSKVTGLALVAVCKRGQRVMWGGEVHHRGEAVKNALDTRRVVRHNRRQRKTRYRPARFLNRRRKAGWLAPSLRNRVTNVVTWGERLGRHTPVSDLGLETARFDTQKLQNPEISGVEYQQGALLGYEVREYLLEKWGRRCAYCGKGDVPLQIEHLRPISRGGSNRVNNLTLACRSCNQRKGQRTATEFGFAHLEAQAKAPLRAAGVLNSTRAAIQERLIATGLSLHTGTGALTKFNRTKQGYPKIHWLDAACVGELGHSVFMPTKLLPLVIRANSRHKRQMCLMDKYGFPRSMGKGPRFVRGFQSGDLVQATVPSGRKVVGVHMGHVAVRASGFFRVGDTDSIPWPFCRLLQHMDGYLYSKPKSVHSSPDYKSAASCAQITKR